MTTTSDINERRAQRIARYDGFDWSRLSDADRQPYRVQAALMPGDPGWDPYAGSPLQRRVRPELEQIA